MKLTPALERGLGADPDKLLQPLIAEQHPSPGEEQCERADRESNPRVDAGLTSSYPRNMNGFRNVQERLTMISRRGLLFALVLMGTLELRVPQTTRGAEDAPEAQSSRPASAPVPSAEAAGRMTLPEGFKATLFAGEPDVVQPIAFTFDDRGRLWVVENYSYPNWLGGPDRARTAS